jgi:hypothetical protein
LRLKQQQQRALGARARALEPRELLLLLLVQAAPELLLELLKHRTEQPGTEAALGQWQEEKERTWKTWVSQACRKVRQALRNSKKGPVGLLFLH